jgi:hypothetical protein
MHTLILICYLFCLLSAGVITGYIIYQLLNILTLKAKLLELEYKSKKDARALFTLHEFLQKSP